MSNKNEGMTDKEAAAFAKLKAATEAALSRPEPATQQSFHTPIRCAILPAGDITLDVSLQLPGIDRLGVQRLLLSSDIAKILKEALDIHENNPEMPVEVTGMRRGN